MNDREVVLEDYGSGCKIVGVRQEGESAADVRGRYLREMMRRGLLTQGQLELYSIVKGARRRRP